MLYLERLTYAMAEHEGWNSSIEQPQLSGSRAWRNHNPGNMRSSPLQIGTQGGFAVFRTDEDGFAAMRLDITQKARGNTSTGLSPQSTLRDLIYKWAPAADNNAPQAYLDHVCKLTGLSPTTTLAELIK